MKNTGLIFLFGLTVIFSNPLFAYEKLKGFKSLSIHEAKQKASAEGKLIFMDFYANWCSPCTWMDQTTFSDPQVIEILHEDYVALKIDIDDKQGYEIKKQFDVKYLPTLLIFNSEGIMIERIEKTITPRTLKEILSKHNEPDNRKIVKHDPNTAPGLQEPFKKSVAQQPTEMKLSPEEQKEYDTKPVNGKVFKLQVGVFERYEIAEKFISDLQKSFIEPVTVKNDIIQGKMVFRIFLGQFESKEEAIDFKQNLSKSHNIESFVI